jgi:beta-glucosidase
MFPQGFAWGAASSAYQIEGGGPPPAHGRGPSVWDVFCRQPGAVHGQHTGDVSCDHYNRCAEDVALMQAMGLRAYRFSISWPRVVPGGTGRVNAGGLDFYDRVVDTLLEADIEPWATLFHWDFPYELQLRGGWLNPDSPCWFAEYAREVTDRLSDRVTRWITINEPQIFVGLGHGEGTHAPGLRLPLRERLLVGHNALLAHGRAVRVIRERARRTPAIGWAPCGRVDYPASESPRDVEAARTAMFSVNKRDCWNNTWWADPVCLGRYPEDALALFAADAPRPAAGDMELISEPLDFYGVNIYSGEPWKAGHHGEPVHVGHPAGHPQTAMRWPVAPESLYWGPRFLHERYGLPIVITENGMANLDWPGPDGQVRDQQRIDYTRSYLLQLARAAREGMAAGYFHWSILDNFEWAEGYAMRFGMIHVDYRTQVRTLKDSALWYRDVIASNGASLTEETEEERLVPDVRVGPRVPEVQP